MVAASTDCALVVSEAGELKGILTDTDVARKVIAPGLEPDATLVEAIMTVSPQCVPTTENAVDALCTMVERKFRHLPVLDGDGAVVGVLDIAKCLYDAISRLERHLSSASSALSTAVLAARPNNGGVGGSSAQQLVDGMVQKLFSPSLGDLLQEAATARTMAADGKPGPAPSLAPTETAQTAAALMVARRGAILLSTESDRCVGIATPKDLLFKLVAKGLDPKTTEVSCIMTRSPDTMPASATVLQALHQLQYGGYRNVPVVGAGGEPLGVLDVLTLMEGALSRQKAAGGAGGGGAVASGARGLWAAAESLVGVPEADASRRRPHGHHSSLPSLPPSQTGSISRGASRPPSVVASAINPLPMAEGGRSVVGTEGGGSVGTSHAPPRVSSTTVSSNPSTFLFKVMEPSGKHMHRIHANPHSLSELLAAVRTKLGMAATAPADETDDALSSAAPPPPPSLILRYDDDEGDRVVISSDEELAEAVNLSICSGRDRLVLYTAVEGGMPEAPDKENAGSATPNTSIGGSALGVAAKIAGKAVTGGALSEQEKVLGAGAMLASLVVGVAALARR
jgi:CBS domain-containing protein